MTRKEKLLLFASSFVWTLTFVYGAAVFVSVSYTAAPVLTSALMGIVFTLVFTGFIVWQLAQFVCHRGNNPVSAPIGVRDFTPLFCAAGLIAYYSLLDYMSDVRHALLVAEEFARRF